jgi:diacylglycerol kinase
VRDSTENTPNTANKTPFRSPNFTSSVGYALKGLAWVFCQEKNFKTHIVLAIVACVTAAFCRFARWEWVTLIICTAIMLAVEVLNTAIEQLVNRVVGNQIDELGGRVKDIAAGACLLTAFLMACIGGLLFLPHLFILLIK